jgi:hypothetical protein
MNTKRLPGKSKISHKDCETRVFVPTEDHDVVIVFPGGKELTVQLRPSNADTNYNGSLDIILPENDVVTCWKGDDMQAAPKGKNCRTHERLAKQLVTQLPGDYS